MDVQLKRGFLEILVLAAMQREDTLYPILKRLEAAKCVTVYALEHNGRLRKYYHITKAGQERIAEFLREWQDVMRMYEFIERGGGDGHDQE